MGACEETGNREFNIYSIETGDIIRSQDLVVGNMVLGMQFNNNRDTFYYASDENEMVTIKEIKVKRILKENKYNKTKNNKNKN